MLVVDDGETNRKLIRLVLGRAGARVEAVENGLQALERVATESFDLILMDMQMPVMDGYAATAALRRPRRDGSDHCLNGQRHEMGRGALPGGRLLGVPLKPIDQDLLLVTVAAA